jgi:hypothetical protein
MNGKKITLKERNEFNAKKVGIKCLEEIEETKTETTITKRVKVVPDVSIPSMFGLLGSDEISYEDVKTLNLLTGKITFVTVPPIFQDTVKISGEVEVVKIDDQNCKHVTTCWVEVNVWGGSMLENIIITNTKEIHDRLTEAAECWIELKKNNGKEVKKEEVIKKKKIVEKKEEVKKDEKTWGGYVSSFLW